MKKLLYRISMALTAILIVSCSNDSAAPQENSFFNLNVGSQWVYKKYNYDLNYPGEYTFSDIIDSVKVEEIVNLNGLDFAKISHKTHFVSYPPHQSTFYTYQRVNEAGHLVGYDEARGFPLPDDLSTVNENSGIVFHPGEDMAYHNTFILPWGTLFYHVLGEMNTTVEGNDFNVVRYTGEGTLTDATEVTRTIYFDYAPQIGRVISQDVLVHGSYGSEQRLVSYQLN
jgi:hypothetical protein